MEKAMNEQSMDRANQAAALVELTHLTVEQIRQLADLHEQGILTDEEFSAKKQELLSRL